MKATRRLTPDNAVFLLLSFEGPDRYSMAGGLGTRVTQLAQALAGKGFPTHLLFVGDPQMPGQEYQMGGRLLLQRWSQWISRYYPKGVYEGEEAKLYDFNESVPSFVLERVVRPAAAAGKTVVVLGEEWHTAEMMCRLSDLLYHEGLRDRTTLFWNANNTMGFDRINWERLAYTTTITTVSKYMKHLMWGLGVNAQVVPNGIPSTVLDRVSERETARLRASLQADLVLCKVARWDPDKKWNAAVEAAAALKEMGLRVLLLARGGIEPHGEEVLRNAARLGLKVKDAWPSAEDYISGIAGAADADVVNIRSHLPLDFLRVLYRGAHAVLANSGHEPFGLAGLEAMASGGLVFTGATGEDYAIHNHNCLVQETGESWEIVSNLLRLREDPEEEERMRQAARRSARLFTWEKVVEGLVSKVEQQARLQGIQLRAEPREERSLQSRTPAIAGRAA